MRFGREYEKCHRLRKHIFLQMFLILSAEVKCGALNVFHSVQTELFFILVILYIPSVKLIACLVLNFSKTNIFTNFGAWKQMSIYLQETWWICPFCNWGDRLIVTYLHFLPYKYHSWINKSLLDLIYVSYNVLQVRKFILITLLGQSIFREIWHNFVSVLLIYI